MGLKIAVLTDKKGETADFYQRCEVALFERAQGRWKETGRFIHEAPPETTPAAIRDAVKELMERLGNCRIIAGRSISGLAYQILNRTGYDIFEIPYIDQRMLDAVLREWQSAREQAQKTADIPREPVSPQNDGIYYLDLVQLQEHFPEISSKQALRPFLETKSFVRLELTCFHMPPWLEESLLSRGLQARITGQEANRCTVILEPRGQKR